VNDKTIKLEKKKSKYDNRKEKRRVQKQFTQSVNKRFAEKAAITFLAEGESIKTQVSPKETGTIF
jgi:hypothetical protein